MLRGYLGYKRLADMAFRPTSKPHSCTDTKTDRQMYQEKVEFEPNTGLKEKRPIKHPRVEQ